MKKKLLYTLLIIWGVYVTMNTPIVKSILPTSATAGSVRLGYDKNACYNSTDQTLVEWIASGRSSAYHQYTNEDPQSAPMTPWQKFYGANLYVYAALAQCSPGYVMTGARLGIWPATHVNSYSPPSSNINLYLVIKCCKIF